jgi:hypothetical protein
LWGWGGGCEKQEGEKVESQKKKQERLRSNLSAHGKNTQKNLKLRQKEGAEGLYIKIDKHRFGGGVFMVLYCRHLSGKKFVLLKK